MIVPSSFIGMTSRESLPQISQRVKMVPPFGKDIFPKYVSHVEIGGRCKDHRTSPVGPQFMICSKRK
jgi:hypothetical protein